MEQKFQPQRTDPVHGSDFVYHNFGANAERRHRHFKAFFAVQDPMVEPPNRQTCPNWKVRPILTWMNTIYPIVWMVGLSISVDEMTMRFKGKHPDKLRVTYKNEGDGFQCDALCDDGFCYQFYFRNEPAPSKYLKQGMSPLHARCMALFDSLVDEFHQCAMDNLYNSATFCKRAYNHSKKVLVHGVTRKGMRGIPACVTQEEQKKRSDQVAARGTVKAAVLKGDPGCPNLIATSVYDTKPVHYLSMICESIKWVLKERNVYNVDSGMMEKLYFLRMNHIDCYNHTMGNVDVADQLRGVYRLDYWVRNRKWWWSILFWSLGTMMSNAYIIYLKVNDEYGIPKSKLLSHHDFQKQIALQWIGLQSEENNEACITISKKRKASSSVTSISPLTLDFSLPGSTSKKIKSSRCTEDSLLPDTGNLKMRLDNTLDHLPVPAKKNARCGLHRFVGIETEKQVSYCSTCNVNLCLQCYRFFHKIPDVETLKMAVKAIGKP